nr:conserved hypothetical protein [Hymenolepis microstoma]
MHDWMLRKLIIIHFLLLLGLFVKDVKCSLTGHGIHNARSCCFKCFSFLG